MFLSRLFALFNRRNAPSPARHLHARIVEQARQPVFYATLGVPDTLDGRFELIALHCFLVMHRLKAEPSGVGLAREVAEAMFADLDASLREMGAGDLGVGKRVKKMGQAFYGRVAAYDGALTDRADLEAALRRNLYGTAPAAPAAGVDALSVYVMNCVNLLERQDISDLSNGFLEFPPASAEPLAEPSRH